MVLNGVLGADEDFFVDEHHRLLVGGFLFLEPYDPDLDSNVFHARVEEGFQATLAELSGIGLTWNNATPFIHIGRTRNRAGDYLQRLLHVPARFAELGIDANGFIAVADFETDDREFRVVTIGRLRPASLTPTSLSS